MNTTNPVKPYLEFCACAVMVTMHASLRDGNWSFIVGDSQLKRFKHLEFVVQRKITMSWPYYVIIRRVRGNFIETLSVKGSGKNLLHTSSLSSYKLGNSLDLFKQKVDIKYRNIQLIQLSLSFQKRKL